MVRSRASALLVAGAVASTATTFAADRLFAAPPRSPADARSRHGTSAHGAEHAQTAKGPGTFAAASLSALMLGASATVACARMARKVRAEATVTTMKAAGDVPFDPAAQAGATEPLGYWDPLGFCKDAAKEDFDKFRAAELKHGRVAMLAMAGCFVQHYAHFPGFYDVPNGFKALYEAPASYGFGILFLIAGWIELVLLPELEKDGSPGDYSGDISVPVTWWAGGNPMADTNAELNNGRLAMFAVVGTMAAEYNTGCDAIDQLSRNNWP